MKTFLKLIAVLVGLFICLVIAAAVAIRVYLPPQKLKALAISTADSKLHRKLEVQSVDFGLVSGLRIQGLRLSESPDFSKGVFLSADTFELKPEWLPLMHKEVVARQIVLEGASAEVIRARDGRFNFSDLLGTAAPAAPAQAQAAAAAPSPATAAAPVAVTVDSLRVEDLSLRYRDEQQQAKADIRNKKAAVDDFSLSGPFPVSVEAQADYAAKGKTYSGTLTAEGTVDLGGGDPAALKADISRFTAQTQGKAVTGSLQFEDAASPKLSLTLQTPELDDAFLNESAGAALVPAGTRIPAITVQADVAYSGDKAAIRSLSVSMPGLSLQGSGSVRLPKSGSPALDIALKAPDMDLAKLAAILPQTRDAGVGGKASLDAALIGTASDPALSDFHFHMTVDPLTSAVLQKLAPAAKAPDGLELPKMTLEASGSGTPETFTLKQVEFRMADLDAQASGTVARLQSKTPVFNLRFATNRFRLASLAEDAESMKQFGLGGSVSLQAAASGTAATPRASGALALDGVAATYQGQTLKNVTGKLQFTQDSVSMPQLSGNLNGGDFRLKVAASDPAAPVVTVSGWMSLLDLGTLQKLAQASGPAAQANPAAPETAAPRSKAPPPLKTSGDITLDKVTHPNFNSGKVTLTWNLTGVTPDMKRLNGTAKLLVGPGQMVGMLDFAKQKGGLLHAMVLPLEAVQKAGSLHIPGFSPPDMNNIPFDKIEGDYSARNGVVSMQPFALEGPIIAMNTTGTADLGTETADLKTAVTLGALPEIDLTITGPFSDLSIRPNLKQQFQSTAKKLLESQGKALLQQFFH